MSAGELAFDPESMVELQDSVSTENSDDDSNTNNRAYVPCGVGVTVQQTEDGLLKVLGVVTGSDLMVGDVLLDINGESVKGEEKEAVAAKLQGRAGSHVLVHVQREGEPEPVSLRLVRHFKARRSATRAPRSGPRTSSASSATSSGSAASDSSPRSPGSPAGRVGGLEFPQSSSAPRAPLQGSSTWAPLAPLSGGGKTAMPGSRERGQPPMSLAGPIAHGGQVNALAGRTSPSAIASGPSFDPSQASFDPEKSTASSDSASLQASRGPTLRQPSYASNKSFDPESMSLSDKSFDPERLSFPTAVSSQVSYDPDRDIVTAQTSYDPERSSMASNTSYDPERQSIYSKSNNPERSFDPEPSHHSFASEASFDPERSTWGGDAGGEAEPFRRPDAEFSIDPEASAWSVADDTQGTGTGPATSISTDFKRSGMHLEHIQEMLRLAIKGEAPATALAQQSLDADDRQASRVCSTVMSFDPEMERTSGSSGVSRASTGSTSAEKSFGVSVSEKSFDPEALQNLSGKTRERSFDPEASQHGIMAGASYDPSVDLDGRVPPRSQTSTAEFDPERSDHRLALSRERSFDPENETQNGEEGLPRPTKAQEVACKSSKQQFIQEQMGPLRTQRAATPHATRSPPPAGAQVSPPGAKGGQGASICVTLSAEGGRFFIRNAWDDAQVVMRIGDEVVKVDGLNLHGMTIEEVMQILEGPAGSQVELDLRTTMGSPKVVTVERREVDGRPANGAWHASDAVGIEHSHVGAPSLNSSPGGGFHEDHLETQYKNVLRELSEKNRIIEELQEQMSRKGGGEREAGAAAGPGNLHVISADESKQALLEARDEEVKRLREELGREVSRQKARDEELKSVKEHAMAQFQEARSARAELDQARTDLRGTEARLKSVLESEERLQAERADLSAEIKTAREEGAGVIRGLQAQLEQATSGASRAQAAEEELVRLQRGNANLQDELDKLRRGMGLDVSAQTKAREQGAAARMDLLHRLLRQGLEYSDRNAFYEEVQTRCGEEFCGLLQRLFGQEYARGMAAGKDAEQRAQLAMVQRQASQSRRARRRGRSRAGSEKSFGASNEVSMEDFDSDEDGVASRQRSRVSHMRSEVSFDPSMWVGDDSEEDEYDEDEYGIGANFRVQEDGQVHCIGLLNGGPAEQSGVLQTGDILLKVDGINVYGKTHSEVLDLVMGAPDTLVELELLQGNSVKTVGIRRDLTSNPRKARAGPQPSGEFDPSLYAGSSSEEDSEEDNDRECGIGMSVGLDEQGVYRVTEVVLGGASDSTDDVRVGDILEGIGEVLVNSEMPQQIVSGLLRGPPKSTVVLHLVRDSQSRSVTVTRQRAENRVWKVLSEYSTMHPEDFEDFTDEEDGEGDTGEASRAARGSKTEVGRRDRAKSAVEEMKRSLLGQNEDIAILRARMEEAERGKEGLLQRINQLLARAQDPHNSSGASPALGAAQSPQSHSGPTAHGESLQTQASTAMVRTSPQAPVVESGGATAAMGGGSGDDVRCGVGLRLNASAQVGGFYHVRGLEPGGPAARSRKVHPGDVLLMIDGVSVRNMDVPTISALILGPAGTWLVLGLQRVDSNGLLVVTHVTLQRARGARDVAAPSPSLGASPAPQGDNLPSGSSDEVAVQQDGAPRPPCGVGVTFGRDKSGYFIVKALAPGGPAERSGQVQVGDTLITVDGQPVKGIRYDQLTPMILGTENSKVLFGLRRVTQPHTLVMAELLRARVGPVGPADRRARQHGARSEHGQGMPHRVLQTLAEEDPSASTRSAASGCVEGAQGAGGGALQGSSKCGVGLTFRKDARGYFTVLAINTEMLANDSGPRDVAIGDTLVKASGSDVKNLNHGALAKLILGPPQSVVQLAFVRRDGSSYVTSAIRSKPVGEAAAAPAPAPAPTAAAAAVSVASPPSDTVVRGSESAGGKGIICDVGLRLRMREEDGSIEVVELLSGGPAAAGRLVQPGDTLLQAGQRFLTGMSLESVYHLLMGPPGSACALVVQKRGGIRQEIALTRAPRQSFHGVPDPAEFRMALA